MTTAEVVKTNEVSLNGTRFPTAGPPRRVLVSLKAPRISIGNEQTNEETRSSSATLTSAMGGIGRNRGMDSTNIDQVWWSTCNIDYDRHLVLPRLATATALLSAASIQNVGFIHTFSFDNTIYAAYGKDIYAYNNATDDWGASLHTLPDDPTDVIELRIAGTMYFIVAHTGGYSYTADGTTWVDKTTNVKFMTIWQDTLYGIDNTGRLRFANDILTDAWTNDAQLFLPDSFVQDLFIAPDRLDNDVIYATAKGGLWRHDDDGTRFRRARFEAPFHDNFGQGSVMWRDSLYMPAGNAVFKYHIGSGAAGTVQIVGPDKRHGLPSDKRGIIRQLLNTQNFLIALMDSTTAPTTLWEIQMGRKGNWGGHRGMVLRSDVGFSPILAYNEIGWSVKWLGGDAGRAITAAHISTAYSEYRMYFAVNGRVYYQPLSVDLINPSEISDYTYALAAEHITSWLDAGDIVNAKLALTLDIHTQRCTATESVKVYAGYDLDNSTWTLLKTITSNGVTTHTFLDGLGDPTGKKWTHIRFKYELVRDSSDSSLSPDITFVQFRWQQKLKPKWGDQVTISLDKKYNGKTPKTMADLLYEAVESEALVLYQARPDSSDQRWVNVENAAGWEQTGRLYEARMTINVLEP